MMRNMALVLAASLLACPAMARMPLELGNQVIVNKSTLGCLALTDMRRVLELYAIQRDEDAALKFARRQVCRQILTGTVGLVEKSGRPLIVDCVRPRGEPDCLWIARLRLNVLEPVDYDPFAR